jgi:phosphatidylglycerol:prolipoprotein diacylglycerol transferase
VIPYFEPPSLHLGPLTIQVFGIFAALGVFLGAKISMRAVRRDGLDPQPIADYVLWGVGAGIVVGHLVHLFLYHPEELAQPWRIFAVWEGLSSFGGLLGAVLAAIVYFRRRRISLDAYSDAFALGIAPGWGIARLGCFAIHDHPGVLTSFPLAVQFPGGARHDLGLYDAVALFAIAAVVHLLRARGHLRGRLLAVVALLYGTQRFLSDFLRATDTSYPDARYLGLTPAQYFCFGLWAYAVWKLAAGRPAGAGEARAGAVAARRSAR